MLCADDVATAGGIRDAVAAVSTAVGPRSDTTFAASGSVVFLHSQPRFCGVGWCIGHCALPVWTQVQLIDADACGLWLNSESGAAASSESWQHNHVHAMHASR
jgi:hypothetical protein